MNITEALPCPRVQGRNPANHSPELALFYVTLHAAEHNETSVRASLPLQGFYGIKSPFAMDEK